MLLHPKMNKSILENVGGLETRRHSEVGTNYLNACQAQVDYTANLPDSVYLRSNKLCIPEPTQHSLCHLNRGLGIYKLSACVLQMGGFAGREKPQYGRRSVPVRFRADKQIRESTQAAHGYGCRARLPPISKAHADPRRNPSGVSGRTPQVFEAATPALPKGEMLVGCEKMATVCLVGNWQVNPTFAKATCRPASIFFQAPERRSKGTSRQSPCIKARRCPTPDNLVGGDLRIQPNVPKRIRALKPPCKGGSMSKHYCYMIRANQHIKIGYSKDIDRRINHMQTGNAYKLEVIAKFVFETESVAREFEQNLHRRYKRFHFRGEWFFADPVLAWMKEKDEQVSSRSDDYAELELIEAAPF